MVGPRSIVVTVPALICLALAACTSGGNTDTSATTVGSNTTGPTTTRPTGAPATTPTSVASPAVTAPPSTVTSRPLEATATVLGPEEMVFDWSADGCSPDMRPDLPARAHRDPDGTVSVVLAAETNHRLVGPDFDHLEPDCEPVRRSMSDVDPGRYRFREWIGALYSDDGRTIHAIVHNEFHGDDASLAMSTRDFAADHAAAAGSGWSYLAATTTGEVLLEPVDGEWRHDRTLCGVASWGAHPDVGCDAVRRWTAPGPGTFHVWIAVADLGVGGGDGVTVGLRRGSEALWTHTLVEGASEPFEAELTVEVPSAGDALDFWVSGGDDASFDATSFEVEINRGPRPCGSRDRSSCLMTALTYSVSDDGGATYSSPAPNEHLVAGVPQRYEPDAGAVGLWQPSNIVRHPDDGFYYMFAQLDVHEFDRDLTGLCLLRTDDLGDPSSWRAWDGTAFGYEFVDPYEEPGGTTSGSASGSAEPCRPVTTSPGWSLVHSTAMDQFVLLSEIPSLDPPGVYFRTSRDLLEWSRPALLLPWKIGFANRFETPFEAYPSLIDPSSDHPSFATIGETAYLYHTRINSYDPLDFDLVRVPVRFDPVG